MENVKNKGSYQPDIITPVVRITDDIPPYWLVYKESREEEYSILCDLSIKGRTGRTEPRSMKVTVYYNRKLLQMDQEAESLIREYLTPVTYELPDDDQEEVTAMRLVMKRFGEKAAGKLYRARFDIDKQARDWAYTQIAQKELREPVAYIWADCFDVSYHLPDDFYCISKGMERALSNSGLRSEYWSHAIFLAGYLKGSRETERPVPTLVNEPFQSKVLREHHICM